MAKDIDGDIITYALVDQPEAGVDENNAGVIIGVLSTTDADTNETHSYTVSDDRFEVVEDDAGNTVLKLKDDVALDYRTEPQVSLTITTDDGNGGTLTEDFTIDVGDVNEGVTAYGDSVTITENGIETGQLYAVDSDGDSLTYSLVSAPDGGSLTITPDGLASFDPGTDFDYLAVGEVKLISFEYRAEDTDGNFDTAIVQVRVTGTNDAPTAVILLDTNVDETAAGVVIGALAATDADALDTHTYTVDDDRFEVVEDGSGTMVLKLKDGVHLDYKTEASVNVDVTVTDSGGLTDTQTITVQVADSEESGPTSDAHASDGSSSTEYSVDWTIALTSGEMSSVPDSDHMTLSDDAPGTVDFSDGSQIEFETIERIA